MVDMSSADMLAQLNRCAAHTPLAPILQIVTVLAAFASLLFIALTPFLGLLPVIILIVGLVGSREVHRREEHLLSFPLSFNLEQEAAKRFEDITAACGALATAQVLWQIDSDTAVHDWKRNAGATSHVRRHVIRIAKVRPPFISTDIDVWGTANSSLRLFFLPDYLYVYQQDPMKSYGVVSYDNLRVVYTDGSFIESSTVPGDAEVIDYTWQYVRVDGGADLRFKYNRQIPRVRYGYVTLTSESGLAMHLQVSSAAAAERFSLAFSPRRRADHGAAGPRSDGPRRKQAPPGNDERARASRGPEPEREGWGDAKPTAYDVLGVSPSATAAEIHAAYRQMAQQYHPDRVAALGPEFRELAERRMKEINLAYDQLRRGGT
jgi:hypothetical protein